MNPVPLHLVDHLGIGSARAQDFDVANGRGRGLLVKYP